MEGDVVELFSYCVIDVCVFLMEGVGCWCSCVEIEVDWVWYVLVYFCLIVIEYGFIGIEELVFCEDGEVMVFFS